MNGCINSRGSCSGCAYGGRCGQRQGLNWRLEEEARQRRKKPPAPRRKLQLQGRRPKVFQRAGCRPGYLAPKIRYNLHDQAQIIRFPELKRLLRSCGLRPEDFARSYSDLPLLLHYGRADMTVAYFGCKVSPPDVQEALLGVPELAERVASFTLFTSEGPLADKQLRVCLELAERQPLRIRHDAALNELVFCRAAPHQPGFSRVVAHGP